eukprot:1101541-Prymnesium_polylepis.1
MARVFLIAIGAKMVVEKFETIVGVRLATQDEMNALSIQYYKKPQPEPRRAQGLQHGDVYAACLRASRTRCRQTP